MEQSPTERKEPRMKTPRLVVSNELQERLRYSLYLLQKTRGTYLVLVEPLHTCCKENDFAG
jgi:hypothetical protein